MNILELDSFNLADTVKFHDRLNPRLWNRDEHLLPDVHAKLLEIAKDFQEFLGVPDLDVKDITISGSNAAFNYTNSSDIDLHLVVDIPNVEHDEVYRELFNAKKYQYNDEHDIRIHGADVELYAQDSRDEHHSQGIYSLLRNTWVSVPKRKKAEIDDASVRSKYEDLAARIDETIKTKNYHRMADLMKKIKTMRQTGLEQNGEFGSDNIAFKLLRNRGYIKKLVDARQEARDAELSLAESKKVKKPFIYGYISESPDGVNPSTKMFLETEHQYADVIQDFIHDTANYLGIKNMPEIILHDDPEWSKQHQSFGMYVPEEHSLHVNLHNRHLLDIMRTTAHELCHCRQHEVETPGPNAGATGSDFENEAHAVAGIVMRNYADKHPEHFADTPLHEGASGYIPTKKEANDPRYKMALSVDIKPGQVGKEANKLALQTDSQGKPALLMKTANLRESLETEFALFESGQDLFEVKMTSGNLAKLAKDIKGVKVGLEFEMIVPNATVEEEGDMEPDYDQDERVRDIDDCVNFFDDGDYNSRNELRRLRENMQEDYWSWKTEKIDEEWYGTPGWEYFVNYLDREEPFDEDDAEEEATNELQAQYGDDITPEEFQTMLNELVEEKRKEYYQEKWDEQGYEYDRAREEFEEEKNDDSDYDEEEWLRSENIRYASDVESHFGHVTWPYYTSSSGDDETAIERIALDFMNGIGADSVAYSSSYHGSYKKWVGNGWVMVGSEKPDDCFSIEPDGSLEANDDDDAGLEFVSPPTPLEQVPDLMKRVQSWAADNGVYTGKHNKTSIHTNISVPGYDLNKLDYLKAALLLGDEYVLREFDRIGNSYAAPAIEKVKQLVQQKPEKAQELLDKMKSQLNAAASKLIHSGTTNKFTSINTKDNRVEFRSPGGDYLSIIADNPQKMIDTVNRMVVTLDAAMDPNKYKQEYQKKLYKVLTGQGGGREAKSGLKQAMKASDKDLLNIFSRYAAGELPRAALKSFVRQAQLERRGKKADAELASHNWAIRRRDSGDIVRTFQADDYTAAHEYLQQYKQKHNITDNSLTYGPYNAGEEKSAQQPSTQFGAARGAPNYAVVRDSDGTVVYRFYADDRSEALGLKHDFVQMQGWGQRDYSLRDESESTPQPSSGPTLNGRPSNPDGDYLIVDRANPTTPVYRFMASGASDAANVLRQWAAANPGPDWNVASDVNQSYGQPGESQPIPGSTLDLQRQRAAAAQRQQGNWGIWINGASRFANQPGEYPRGATPPMYRFPSREAAEQWIEQQRAERPRMRTDIEVREIEPREPLPDLFPELPGTPAAQQGNAATYEIYNRNSGAVIDTFTASNDQEALQKLADYRNSGRHSFTPAQAQASFGVRRGPGVDNTAQPSSVNSLTPHGPGPWEIYNRDSGESVRRLDHTNRAAAETEAQAALRIRGEAPELYGVRTQQATPETPDQQDGGVVDVAGEQPATGGSFTGEWKVLLPDGREVYRFSGIGNSQADANRVAADWLRNNGMGVSGEGFEVLPVMG